MEGLLTIIILIIIFNLFNFLARFLKGQPSNQKGTDLFEKKEFVSDPDHTGQARTGRYKEDQQYASFFDMPKNEYHEKDRVKTHSQEEKNRPVVEETKRKAIGKKDPSANLSGNLKQLLTNKDPLITAFIFHEIIDPPRNRRRKP